MLHWAVVIANTIPRFFIIISFFGKQDLQGRILDGYFHLSNVFYIAIRPDWFYTLRYLPEDEGWGRSRSNRNSGGVATTVAFENFWFTESLCELDCRCIGFFFYYFKYFTIEGGGFIAFKSEMLGLKEWVVSEDTETESSVCLSEVVRSLHKVEGSTLLFIFVVTKFFKLLNEVFHHCVEECDHCLNEVGVLPGIVVEKIEWRETAHKRPVVLAWKHDFTTHVTGVNAEIFIFVHINSVFVGGVTKHDVRIAHFTTSLDDAGPYLALGFIAGNHRLHPLVSDGDTMCELLDGIAFGTDI